MQSFNLTINTTTTGLGNIPLPSGVVVKVSLYGIQMKESEDLITYYCEAYVSQTDLDNGEEPIFLAGIHATDNSRGGLDSKFYGSRKGSDFSFSTEMSGDRINLTTASVNGLKGLLKSDLANSLGISDTDIS